MTERMYFFDSTEDDERIYQAADFARFHNQIIGSGVSNTKDLPDLEVTARNNMEVALGAGYMFANGYMYELTETMNLKHDVADPDHDRIDRVIIRFDNNPEKREIKAVIKKGTPSARPVPKTLTRDNYIYEMSVAQVLIKAGKSYVEDDQITDERENDAVCGYIPLHNIYRGLGINEHGMVTMPNQSYVEVLDDTDLTLKSDDSGTYVETRLPIRADVDRQREIKDGAFKAKADGVYQFNLHIALKSGEVLRDQQRIEGYLVINGENTPSKRIYLFNQTGSSISGINFMGNGTKLLKKGDKVEMFAGIRNDGDVDTRYRRITISKLS